MAVVSDVRYQCKCERKIMHNDDFWVKLSSWVARDLVLKGPLQVRGPGPEELE